MDKGFVEFAAKITILHRDPNFFKNETSMQNYLGKVSKLFSDNFNLFYKIGHFENF